MLTRDYQYHPMKLVLERSDVDHEVGKASLADTAWQLPLSAGLLAEPWASFYVDAYLVGKDPVEMTVENDVAAENEAVNAVPSEAPPP